MNNTEATADPLAPLFSEEAAVQSIAATLRMGRLEEAVQQTVDLVERQSLRSGGMPTRLSETWEDFSLTAALQEQPLEVEARVDRGHSRFVRGLIRLLRKEPAAQDIRGAFDDLAAVASLKPQDVLARVWLANLIIFTARYVPELAANACASLMTARRELKDAMAMDPGCAAAHHARGLISLFAAGYVKNNGADPRRHFTKAIDSFREALRLDPSYPRTHQNLGLTLKGFSRWQESKGNGDLRLLQDAAKHFEEAMRLDPTLWKASYKAGQIYLQLGMNEEARRCLEHCRTLNGTRRAGFGKLEGQLWQSVVTNVD